jgi:hypothetical protein
VEGVRGSRAFDPALIAAMFVLFIVGLALIVAARLA